MKRICIYVALGVLGAFSAHAQEINIGQTVARKISDDKVEVSFSMDCSTLRLPSRRQMVITPLIISRSESDTLALPSVCIGAAAGLLSLFPAGCTKSTNKCWPI